MRPLRSAGEKVCLFLKSNDVQMTSGFNGFTFKIGRSNSNDYDRHGKGCRLQNVQFIFSINRCSYIRWKTRAQFANI